MTPAEAALILSKPQSFGGLDQSARDRVESVIEFECRNDIARERREAAEWRAKVGAA